ncbi:SLC13 family permease [uncultured Metabacillus sp.]|uniref:SLC13 family permease n=1 Tax=uncultured Metabacillus sp. TaxID=2860135 RepID=UPI00262FD152|nr:SLC13 family permease [uncultured Metabacillus sp.]
MIGYEKRPQKAIFKLMLPAACISMFMNNTPLVVILTPLVRKWARKIGLPETKLLIPLLYAVILGGMCTLIGTSTNIVISGLLMDRTGTGFSMFELGLIGIPCAIIGILYMTFIGSSMLPNHGAKDSLKEKNCGECLVQAKIASTCPMVGKTIKEVGLLWLKQGYFITIIRNGKSIFPISSSKTLQEDDFLLLKGDDETIGGLRSIQGLTLEVESEYKSSYSPEVDKESIFLISIFIMMIVSVGLGWIKMITAVCIAVVILLFSRSISIEEARNSIEWKLLIMIGSSFGIAKALEKTGVASAMAEWITSHVMNYGPIVILSVIFFLTWMTTELLSNNAAATMIFPIAYSVAEQMALDPTPFAITIAIAASTSFATPIGYQSNMIVYGTGGYSFSDFLKVGIPLGLITMLVSMLLIPFFWPF